MHALLMLHDAPHRFRVTARLEDVKVTDAACSAFWLRASGCCELRRCVAERAGADGVYCDAAAPCVFDASSASHCAESGFKFDFPSSKVGSGGAAAQVLAAHAHSAKARLCVPESDCVA
jgi:hypothetical protein